MSQMTLTDAALIARDEAIRAAETLMASMGAADRLAPMVAKAKQITDLTAICAALTAALQDCGERANLSTGALVNQCYSGKMAVRVVYHLAAGI